MTERRDPEGSAASRAHQPSLAREAGPEQSAVQDLQRQAGNKAVADLLGGSKPVQTEPASPALRLRDSLRADRPPVQREFGLAVQRLDKADLKEPGRLLRRGTRGSDVAMVQQLLGVNADGIFGGQTLNRVIEFQLASGLAPDGIVGPLTFSALVSATATTGKLPSTIDKLPPETTDKLPPETTDKVPTESTDKLPPETTDKLPTESTDKIPPESTDKQFESTDKLFESTDKLT